MPSRAANDRGISDNNNNNSRHHGRKRRPSSLTMARAPTQLTVDRIVGTVAIVGLSVAFARWLTNNNGGDGCPPPATPSRASSGEGGGGRRRRRRGTRGWMPWWWPVIAMQRWNERNRTAGSGERADDNAVRGGGEDSANDDGENSHQGSCHCGSIKFVVSPTQFACIDRLSLSSWTEYYMQSIVCVSACPHGANGNRNRSFEDRAAFEPSTCRGKSGTPMYRSPRADSN